MKFLERTPSVPAGQDTQPHPGKTDKTPHTHPSGLRLHTGFKRLCHWISTIHTLFSHATEKTPRSPSWKPVHSGTSVNFYADKGIPAMFDDIRMPWVKTGRLLQSSACQAVDQLKAGCLPLIDQSILCIGGRAALYADYHRLIEAAGGHFMVFRSGTQNNTDCLLALLDCVNIVICPVDCINHTDFFTVKRYCQRTRKYCVMLQRSDLATFGKAVEILIRDNFHPQKAGKMNPDNRHLPQLGTASALAG